MFSDPVMSDSLWPRGLQDACIKGQTHLLVQFLCRFLSKETIMSTENGATFKNCTYTYTEYYVWTRRNASTGICQFLKVCFMPLCFYKGPALEPIFCNRKKSKGDFSFYEKRWKLHSASVLQQLSWRQHAPRVARAAPPSSFLGNYPQLPASSTLAWNWVCEHLCFTLIYFAHLLARLPPRNCFSAYHFSL